MIDKLIETLRQANLEEEMALTPVEVAEMLLLARFMSVTAATPSLAAGDLPAQDVQTGTTPDKPAEPLPPPEGTSQYAQPLERGDLVLPSAEIKGGGGAGVGAQPFRTPKARALPGVVGISRALRPLRRRHPSSRRFVIDEERTVRQICDGGPKTVVLRPAMERWLEVAIVADDSVSMHIWRPTIREFHRLLEQHGAFSKVHLYKLIADEPAIRLFRQTATQRLSCHPRELSGPAGRRLIVVISDCTSAGWYDGDAYQLLVEWGRSAPTVLVQVLPHWFWPGTSMTDADAVLSATAAGLPNRRLNIEPEEERRIIAGDRGVAIPIVTLDEWSIAPWARLLAGIGHAAVPGMAIPDLAKLTEKGADKESIHQPPLPQIDKSAEERVSGFRFSASPLAQELAGYLAAVPLSLPVMQLVQQAMLPQSRQSTLAEIFRSDLVGLPAGSPDNTFSDDHIFDFHEGVRDLLLDEVSRLSALRVLSEVERFIFNRLGQAGEFDSLIATPHAQGGDGKRQVDPLALAFCKLGARTLRRIGIDEDQAAHWEKLVRSVEGAPAHDDEQLPGGIKPLAQIIENDVLARLEQFGDSRNAITLHAEAVQWKMRRGDTPNILMPLNRLASELAGIGELDTAFELYTHLQIFAEKFGDETYLAEAASGLAKVDEAKGRPILTSFSFDTITLDEGGNVKKRLRYTARQFIEELAPGINLEMVEVPGGHFMMGTAKDEVEKVRAEYKRYGWWEGWVDRETPQHEVAVSPFYIGKFTITQEQWRVVAGWEKVNRDLDPNPSRFKNKNDSDDRPVEQVNWHDSVEFCARLAKKTGRAYRLPSEAEWEYACRAGTTTPFAFGETITPEFVNYQGEYPYGKAPKGRNRGETVPVGSLGVANAFGLFDMHGNVWEWCRDWYDAKYYEKCKREGIVTDPSGPENGTYRVLRGGSWINYSNLSRSAFRYPYGPDDRYGVIGLRVVVSVARTP